MNVKILGDGGIPMDNVFALYDLIWYEFELVEWMDLIPNG